MRARQSPGSAPEHLTNEESSFDSREFFRSFVKGNRLFILGAGFSAGAGIPLTRELLPAAMKRFEAETELFERVDHYAWHVLPLTAEGKPDYATDGGFSKLCTYLEYVELREHAGGERWSELGSKEKLSLRYYLAKEIVARTPAAEAIPQVYLDFAAQLHPGDLVITFNWDCLLERALERIGKPYTYTFTEDRSKVRVHKMHGSVNWRLDVWDEVDQRRHVWHPIGLSGEADVLYTDQLHRVGAWPPLNLLSDIQPFIVLPGYGKAFDIRAIAGMWYKPEWAFAFVNDVFIIGLSLAEDDFFVRSFFLHTLPGLDVASEGLQRRVVVINRSATVHKNYAFCTSNGMTTIVQEPFCKEHLKLFAPQE